MTDDKEKQGYTGFSRFRSFCNWGCVCSAVYAVGALTAKPYDSIEAGAFCITAAVNASE